MTPPRRVRLARSKGWTMPANTVKVDRTTPWGNPISVADSGSVEPPSLDRVRHALAGRNLACWCALDGPCHADLLLAIANRP